MRSAGIGTRTRSARPCSCSHDLGLAKADERARDRAANGRWTAELERDIRRPKIGHPLGSSYVVPKSVGREGRKTVDEAGQDVSHVELWG